MTSLLQVLREPGTGDSPTQAVASGDNIGDLTDAFRPIVDDEDGDFAGEAGWEGAILDSNFPMVYPLASSRGVRVVPGCGGF